MCAHARAHAGVHVCVRACVCARACVSVCARTHTDLLVVCVRAHVRGARDCADTPTCVCRTAPPRTVAPPNSCARAPAPAAQLEAAPICAAVTHGRMVHRRGRLRVAPTCTDDACRRRDLSMHAGATHCGGPVHDELSRTCANTPRRALRPTAGLQVQLMCRPAVNHIPRGSVMCNPVLDATPCDVGAGSVSCALGARPWW